MEKEDPLKKKILKHLEGLNELERRENSKKLIKTLAERYKIPEVMVEKTIADWQANKA